MTAQATNSAAKRSFAFGPVIARTQPCRPPSAVIAERAKIRTIRPATVTAAPNSIGCWKATVKSCTGTSLRGRSVPPSVGRRSRRCDRPADPSRRSGAEPSGGWWVGAGSKLVRRTEATADIRSNPDVPLPPGAARVRGCPRQPTATPPLRDLMSFERLGSFAGRRRWAIVGAWLLLLLVALPLAPRAPSVLSAGGVVLGDLPSSQARLLLEHELDLPPSALVLVYTPRGLTIGTPQWSAAVNSATSEVATAPHVKRVLSHLIAPRQVAADGSIAYDVVLLDLPADASPDAVPPVAARLHPVAGLTVEPAGGPVFYGDVQSVSESDLRRSEVVSLPLAGLVLLLVFASVVAAGIPLVVGGAAVIVALATIYIVGSVTSMSVFVLNLATLLGLGLGVDYSLLMTSRFREELARRDGPDRVEEAVRVTVATAGRAVFFSGLTVLLGLLGLVLFEFMILRSVGMAGAIVVGLAVSAAITLLPAILAILGTRVDALAVRT